MNTDALRHMERLEGLGAAARRKIFNLGLSKTGNNSLRQAVHLLGWTKTLGFVADATIHEECIRLGVGPLTYAQQVDFMTDLPVVGWWRRIFDHYPDAYYVLTLRDRHAWLDSLERQMTHYRWPPGSVGEALRVAVYGSHNFNRKNAIDVFERHNEAVVEFFETLGRPEQLLVMDIASGEGWGMLCHYLDVPIPDAPFPHANRGVGK